MVQSIKRGNEIQKIIRDIEIDYIEDELTQIKI